MTTPIELRESLDGPALRTVFAAASQHLRESALAIDAINVYPVPDGDTGSNMSATLREAVERALALESEPTVAEVLSAISRGALYGARGNSGVILSQALAGFAAGVGSRDRLDGRSLADGLDEAATRAYAAVSQPKEGTMLTVLRAAGEGARESAAKLEETARGTGCARVLGEAVIAAEKAEAFTIEQLPSLKEAGVTDAGGEGICVILRGLLAAITGGALEGRSRPAELPFLHAGGHGDDSFGFCTEFLIERAERALDPGGVRALAEANGNRSVVVVGDDELIRVHAHSLLPQALLDAAEKLGKLARVKVEDMSAQNTRFRESGSGAGVKVAMLAMSPGEGFDDIFESLGAAVSDLGLIEKPPAGRIAEDADALRVADVIVLANHPNVILAAEQARSLATCTLHVVTTTSVPQGIAAAIAFDSAEPARGNVEAMLAAASGVKTIEVTIAAASRRTDGIDVAEGEAIAMLDGVLVAKAEDAESALAAGLARAAVARDSLVTLYGGEEIAAAELSATAVRLRERFPGVEVEALSGGQALYPYIASIE